MDNHNTIHLHQHPQHSIILFDGVCNLCSSSVQRVLKNDKDGHFLFASLQSSVGQQILQQYHLPVNHLQSFVLIENGTAYTRSTAALKVARKLQGGYKWLYPLIVIPIFIRDAVYNFIARNRYKWFGKRASCWLPKPEWKSRFLD